MTIESVGVVGCGLMGSGIAQVCAEAGYRTVVREASDDLVQNGIGRIDQALSRNVAKGRMTEAQKGTVLGRISATTDFNALATCDLIIEAVTENTETKKEALGIIDSIAPPSTILASNTSSISITELASATQRPHQVLGLHFFNPVPVMRLIEMVIGLRTSPETRRIARAFGTSLQKQVIEVKDTPGFIVNYLLIPYLLDAVRLVESGVASREDVDSAMVLGCGHPLGPLKLLDFIGLDTTLYISEVLYDAFRSDRYVAPPLLRQMVVAGLNGRKSGEGFYKYE